MPEKTRFLSFKNAKICLLCIVLHVRILNDLVQLQHVRCPNEVLLLSLVVIECFQDFSFFPCYCAVFKPSYIFRDL